MLSRRGLPPHVEKVAVKFRAVVPSSPAVPRVVEGARHRPAISENEGMLSFVTRLHTWWQGVTCRVTVS